MEAAAVWLVAVGLAAFAFGALVGALLTRARRTSSPAEVPAAGTTPPIDAVGAGADGRDATPRTDGADVDAHRFDPRPSPTPAAGPVTSTTPLRDGASLRSHYADIIGLESENASLRAVAARVPALERRIRELETHAGPAESSDDIDLTTEAATPRQRAASPTP